MKPSEEFEKLFPKLSDGELVIAMENFDRYLSLAWEIVEDRKMEQMSDSLAESESRGTMHVKVDSPKN
jgi:hypothetical protein